MAGKDRISRKKFIGLGAALLSASLTQLAHAAQQASRTYAAGSLN